MEPSHLSNSRSMLVDVDSLNNEYIPDELTKNIEYQHVMQGRFEHLPPTNSKFIKIFLSSTFSDLATERNHLMRDVYPRLKEYCRSKYGVEFQVVDMRWGVRQEAEFDHLGPQLCFEELRNCQAVSAGPSFLTILGQRYGSHPPPYNIPATDFDDLIETLSNEAGKESAEAVAVLIEWYQKDENCCPSEYVLRPIAENVHEMSKTALEDARKKWRMAEPVLIKSFTRVAQEWQNSGRHPPAYCHKYFCSVTEQEIILGILDHKTASMSRRYAAAFLRTINDVEFHLEDKRIDKFMDMRKDTESGQLVVDSHLQRLMHNLREVELKRHLLKSRIFSYHESWNSVVEAGDAREEYLSRFAEDFKLCCQNLVNESMQQYSKFTTDDLFAETLHHSTLCVKHLCHFQGREDILKTLKEYITGQSNEPLVVYGQSGSGKTSVLAKCAREARYWLPEEREHEHAIVLLRFLGTSPGTSNVRQTMRNICRQLASFSSEADQERAKKLDSMKDILNFFTNILNQISSVRKVMLFLDSMDQLDGSDSCHYLGWLPDKLPCNVKLVVSTLPDMFGLLDTLRSRLLKEELFLEVTPLETNMCIEILRSQLKEVHRQLTEAQWNVLRVALDKCSLPIFVTLMLHQAKTWRSFFPFSDSRLRVEHSVRDAILQLFSRLEKKHGKLLVRRALGYITASRSGLSEAEMEDLLSLDDDVLRDVFQYHLPPQIRIPPFCWSRLLYDLSNYLVEREADGVRVIFWYHRQFTEAATDYFLESDREEKQNLHSLMADYFLGIWGGERKKPLRYPDYLKTKLGLPDSEERNRHVPEQPFVFEENELYETTLNNGKRHVRVNLRKLNQLPKHLANANRMEECFREVVFNYDFLFNKLRGTSLQELLKDINRVVRKCAYDLNEVSVRLVYNAIRVSPDTLNSNCHNLRVDLLGRLLPFSKTHPWIQHLLKSCDTIGGQHSVLRPRYQMLDSGSSDIYTTFEMMPMSIAVLLPNNLICSLCMTDKFIRFYDTSGSLVRCVDSDYFLVSVINQFPKNIPPDCTVNVIVRTGKRKEDENGESLEISSGTDCVRVNLSTGKAMKLFSMPMDVATADVEYFGREWAVLTQGKHRKFFDISRRKVCFEIGYFNNAWYLSKRENALTVLNSENTNSNLLTLHVLPQLNKRYVKTFATDHSSEWISHCCFSNLEVLGLVRETSGYFLVRHIPKESSENSEEGELREFQRHALPADFVSNQIKGYSQPNCSPSEDLIFLANWNSEKVCQTLGYIWNRVNEHLISLNLEKDTGNISKYSPVYSADEKLILFSGEEVQGIVFSTETGEVTRYISRSRSDRADIGLLGVTTNSNLLVATCRVNTRTKDEWKLSLVCRTYNIYPLQLDEREAINYYSFEEEIEECDSVEMTWDFDTNKLVSYSGDPLNDLYFFNASAKWFLMDMSDSTQSPVLVPLNENSDEFIILRIQQTEPTNVFCIYATSSTDIYCGSNKLFYYTTVEEVDGINNINTWAVMEGTPMEDVQSLAIIDSTLSDNRNESTFSVLLSEQQLILEISWQLFRTINLTNDEQRKLNVIVSSLKNLQQLVTIPLRVTTIEQSPNFITFETNKTETENDGSQWKFDSLHHNELNVNDLRLIQILPRPSHNEQLVLVAHAPNSMDLFMCALREKPNLNQQNLFSPGVFIVLDYAGMSESSNFSLRQTVCWSDIFGPVVLLEDGLHAVNYRLQVLNIETGRPIQYIRPPEEEIYLIGIMPLLNNDFICGALIPAMLPIIIGVGVIDVETETDMDDYIHPSKLILRVYRVADGALVGDYPFPEEIQALQTNRSRSSVYILANNAPLSVVDIDSSCLAAPHVSSKHLEQSINQDYCQIDYFSKIGLDTLLKNALLELVEKRPSDPILHLATYLRTFRAPSEPFEC